VTTPPPPAAGGILRAVRARSALVRTVRTLLQGSGLDVRELASAVVISKPGHPDQGRIHITYAGGEVSLRRCTWHYLGYLEGYGSPDPEAEPCLSAAKIIAALTGPQDGPP
jgi:hypothetical protein